MAGVFCACGLWNIIADGAPVYAAFFLNRKGPHVPMRAVLFASCALYVLLHVGCMRPWLLVTGFAWLLLVAWHVCFALYVASLVVCAVQGPVVIYDARVDEELDARALAPWLELAQHVAPAVPLRLPGQPRYCVWCQRWQPQRFQHCLLCHVCVARQDHHSRVLGHCVGQGNWKPYVQFLFYGLLCCATGVAWAMLRLLEMGEFVVLGPSDAAADQSKPVVACLIAAVALLCLVLPMFALTLAALLKGALRNQTMAERREMAAAGQRAPLVWPLRKASAVDNLKVYLGPVITWWRPW